VFATTLSTRVSPEHLAAVAAKLSVVASLLLACFSILAGIPFAAARGKLHIPGYVGVALLAFAIGLLLGRIAGAHGVTGTLLGFSLSIVFFLLIATAVGSVLALFFYHHPDV